MPYISPDRRDLIDNDKSEPITPGELTYTLTKEALEYLELKGAEFTTFAEILGAFEAARHEFYRRIVAPYEEVKCELNGDVYL